MASSERHERYETYGSSNLRVEYKHDERRKKLKVIPCLKTFMIIGVPTMMVLKLTIRKKLKKLEELPLVNIVFKKTKEKNIFLNPEIYLQGDHEKYFELLKEWKSVSEDKYLRSLPQTDREFLRFEPYRQEKTIFPRKK